MLNMNLLNTVIYDMNEPEIETQCVLVIHIVT